MDSREHFQKEQRIAEIHEIENKLRIVLNILKKLKHVHSGGFLFMEADFESITETEQESPDVLSHVQNEIRKIQEIEETIPDISTKMMISEVISLFKEEPTSTGPNFGVRASTWVRKRISHLTTATKREIESVLSFENQNRKLRLGEQAAFVFGGEEMDLDIVRDLVKRLKAKLMLVEVEIEGSTLNEYHAKTISKALGVNHTTTVLNLNEAYALV
mmetsp:Transcript_29895/g.33960  ORF Transcript_29895/g.33960 Transcript_29895/m.33960 type:complete len:216 (-) Transcript_29895:687-1334(-)